MVEDFVIAASIALGEVAILYFDGGFAVEAALEAERC